jgi:hypothetical protein
LAIAKEKGITAQRAALTDILVEPHFNPLDLSEYKGKVGDKIMVIATDDIGLADFEFTLTKADGTRIEQGKAVEEGARTGHWSYTATVPVALGSNIFVEARGVDHAGNKTVASLNPIVGQDL